MSNEIKVKEPYNNLYGMWHVTTEGDTIATDLGIWEGYVDEIALYLADKSNYGLMFHSFEPKKPGVPTRSMVSVMFDIDSGLWDTSSNNDQIANEYLRLFQDNNRPVKVRKSNLWHQVYIETDEKTLSERRAEALARISPEDRKLLGLE